MTDHERARARVREREMLKKLPERLLGRLPGAIVRFRD